MSGGESNIHSTSPDAFAVVYTFDKEKTEIGGTINMPADFKTKEVILSKDLISMSTSKGKGGIGTFSITLGSSQNYKAILHVGCWVAIYMNDVPYSNQELKTVKNGKDSGLKMIGIIKSLRVNEGTAPSGHRFVRYEISGEDFHTLFESKIYISSLFRIHGSGSKAGFAPSYYITGDAFAFNAINNPGNIAKILFDRTFSWPVTERATPTGLSEGKPILGGTVGMPPAFADRIGAPNNPNGNFHDAITPYIQNDLGGLIVAQPSVGDQFTIWSLMKAYSNPILNELYTDLFVSDTQIIPGFVLRAIPFSSKSEQVEGAKPEKGQASIHTTKKIGIDDPYVQLFTSKEIHEHEIVSLNYGKSDGERFNFFYISSGLSREKELQAEELINVIGGGKIENLADSTSIARYGLRPYITSSPYIYHSDDAKMMNMIVRDMWATAHLYENGQVTIVGSHVHIPVGTNIKFVDRKWTAHVEAVSNHYHVGGDGVKEYMTTITFVRLQNEKNEPIDLMDRSTQREYDRGITHSEGGEE